MTLLWACTSLMHINERYPDTHPVPFGTCTKTVAINALLKDGSTSEFGAQGLSFQNHQVHPVTKFMSNISFHQNTITCAFSSTLRDVIVVKIPELFSSNCSYKYIHLKFVSCHEWVITLNKIINSVMCMSNFHFNNKFVQQSGVLHSSTVKY